MADKTTSKSDDVGLKFLHVRADAVKAGDIITHSSGDGSIQVWGSVESSGTDTATEVTILTANPVDKSASAPQKQPFSVRLGSSYVIAVARKA